MPGCLSKIQKKQIFWINQSNIALQPTWLKIKCKMNISSDGFSKLWYLVFIANCNNWEEKSTWNAGNIHSCMLWKTFNNNLVICSSGAKPCRPLAFVNSLCFMVFVHVRDGAVFLIYTYDRSSCFSFITSGSRVWFVCLLSGDVMDRSQQKTNQPFKCTFLM